MGGGGKPIAFISREERRSEEKDLGDKTVITIV
jgi:hypothetical protein